MNYKIDKLQLEIVEGDTVYDFNIKKCVKDDFNTLDIDINKNQNNTRTKLLNKCWRNGEISSYQDNIMTDEGMAVFNLFTAKYGELIEMFYIV